MKSSFCAKDACVDVEFEGPVFDVPHVVVSDAYGNVSFTHEEWATFVQGVKAGEFDLPRESGR